MVAEGQHRSAASPEATSVRPRVSLPKAYRAAAALIVGLLVTFTGTLHETLAFDHAVAIIAFALFAFAHLYAWWRSRSDLADPVSLMLAVVSVIAAIATAFTQTPAGLAVVIAAWALVQGLLEFVGGVTRPGGRQDSTILGALGLILAIAVLLVFRDPVAIIGFFGAYALIVGVFLGIAAFDTRGPRETPTDITQKDQHD